AVACTALFVSDAHQIGIADRTGWLTILSGLPSPVPPPSGTGTFTVSPSYTSGSRFHTVRQTSMYSLMRVSGFWYGTPWKPSTTWGPDAPRPQMARPSLT